MRNFFFSKIFTFLGSRLVGKKTYIGGAALILLGLSGCVGKMFPDSGVPEMDFDTILGYISAGLAAFGIGHKSDRLLTALSTSPTTTPSPVLSPATGSEIPQDIQNGLTGG